MSFWANRGTATKPSFERVAWLDDALPVAGLHACHLSFMDADGDGALDIFRATMGLVCSVTLLLLLSQRLCSRSTSLSFLTS